MSLHFPPSKKYRNSIKQNKWCLHYTKQNPMFPASQMLHYHLKKVSQQMLFMCQTRQVLMDIMYIQNREPSDFWRVTVFWESWSHKISKANSMAYVRMQCILNPCEIPFCLTFWLVFEGNIMQDTKLWNNRRWGNLWGCLMKLVTLGKYLCYSM